MNKSIYIYGASGHGQVVADIAKACGYNDIIFIDDGDNEYQDFEDVKIFNDIPVALGVGNNAIRAKIFNKIKKYGFKIISLVHPSSIVSPSATIKKGTVIMPHVVINAHAIIEEGVILNSSCIIEHDCIIENFVHISPGVALAGNVKVGKYTHIGIGTNVIQDIVIGNNTIIGAGSNVIKNIDNCKTAYGNPCREMKGIK